MLPTWAWLAAPACTEIAERTLFKDTNQGWNGRHPNFNECTNTWVVLHTHIPVLRVKPSILVSIDIEHANNGWNGLSPLHTKVTNLARRVLALLLAIALQHQPQGGEVLGPRGHRERRE